MISKSKKIILTVSIAFALLLVGCFLTVVKIKNIPVELPFATVKIGDGDVVIRCWDDGDENYLFLPSCSGSTDTVLVSNSKIKIDGELLENGSSFVLPQRDVEYEITDYDYFIPRKYKLSVCHTQNLPSMFVSTESASMDYVYSDKNNKEKSEVLLVGESCDVLYRTDVSFGDEIKAHGNSTFNKEKKSFRIKFGEPTEMLGMDSAEKWLLISNCMDASLIRNKLVYEVANSIYGGFTPNGEYVDLYLNGEYNGVYLLCEKVEYSENRLNAETDGDFLIEKCYENKVDREEPFFETELGHFYEVKYPENCSDQELDFIKCKTEELEAEIYSESESVFNIMDIESRAAVNLIDEFFINSDMGMASVFIKYKTSEDKFYYGPLWDYDLSSGNGISGIRPGSSDPLQIWGNKSYMWDYENELAMHLYNIDSYVSAMKELYIGSFRDVIYEMYVSGIDEIYDGISRSAENDSIRWKSMYNSLYSGYDGHAGQVAKLKEFIGARIDYIDFVAEKSDD